MKNIRHRIIGSFRFNFDLLAVGVCVCARSGASMVSHAFNRSSHSSSPVEFIVIVGVCVCARAHDFNCVRIELRWLPYAVVYNNLNFINIFRPTIDSALPRRARV